MDRRNIAALAAADKVRAEGERKTYDEAEAKRIDEALAIFFDDLSRFETRADAVWEAARSWERVIEALTLVQRGIRAGKIEDQSLLTKPKPTDTKIDVVSLSSIIDAALVRKGLP